MTSYICCLRFLNSILCKANNYSEHENYISNPSTCILVDGSIHKALFWLTCICYISVFIIVHFQVMGKRRKVDSEDVDDANADIQDAELDDQ